MTVTTDYRVNGMHCGHCVAAVTEEVSALPGVHDVQIDLVVNGASTVRVTSEQPLDNADVAEAVDDAGYALDDGRTNLPLA